MIALGLILLLTAAALWSARQWFRYRKAYEALTRDRAASALGGPAAVDDGGRIPADAAYRTTMKTKSSKWPDRTSDRIEPLCLPAIKPGFTIDRDASVFTIGSCFARHIEMALADHGLSVPTLGFRVPRGELWAGTGMITGILNKYTPFSMLNEIEFVLGATDGSEFLIQTGDDAWWDGQLHTTESVPLARALKRRQKLRELYDGAIRQSSVVIITLGLIEAWWDDERQLYLNDTAPKALVDRHPGRFYFEVLPIEKVIAAVRRLIALLHDMNPAQKVLLTVSPVPFVRSFSGKDAVIANSFSKSSLRVAAEIVAGENDWVDYYPSFESVTHSDRALAWEDDLVHVRQDLVRANIQRMVRDYVEPERATAP